MPLHSKLLEAFKEKENDPEKVIPVRDIDRFTLPGTGTFRVFIKDWGTLDDAYTFDGIGVESVLNCLVEFQGTTHSFNDYGIIFDELLNGAQGLRVIEAFSISGISSPSGGVGEGEYYGLLHLQAHCDKTMGNAAKRGARGGSGRQPAPPPPTSPPTPPPRRPGPAPEVVADAINGLRGMGFNKRDAAAMVAGVEGNTVEELIRNALKAHGQKGPKRTEAVEVLLGEQEMPGARGFTMPGPPATASGTMGGGEGGAPSAGPATLEDPAGGEMAPSAGVSTDLRNGVWYHIPTHRDFPINDEQWSASPADAPILALGHNLTRLLNSDSKAASWYDENPPPMRPKEPVMYPAYARAMRSYLKKMALQAIENWGWILFWHGFLYTNGAPLNFRAIHDLDNELTKLGRDINDNATVAVMDANNNRTLRTMTWGELKNSNRVTASGFGRERNVTALRQILRTMGREMQAAAPSLVTATYRAEGLKVALFRALCETTLLEESLTYNQMLTATARYWRTRLRTVRTVHTQPPALVMMQDGTVDLAFDFESRPSTEGRPHRGYVKFIPEKGGKNWLEKLKELLGQAARGIQKFFGKKVPPQILKGSDLRKMLVEVSCDCKDFKYRMSWANVKAGVTTQAGRTDNGQAPVITNPGGNPGFCKHILATVRYLTDDAELTVSAQFSRAQQEALAKDRARFMKEAEEAYERMEAPEAPEEAKPEEEEPPPGPEIARLPEPPKPITPAEPPSPAAPSAPPSPSYQSLQ